MSEATSRDGAKFDAERAALYGTQARIALAGYDECHALGACVLQTTLGVGGKRRILVVGAGGTGREVIAVGALEPDWLFTAVDPSKPMLAIAQEAYRDAGLLDRVTIEPGELEEVDPSSAFDAAICFGVLHHLRGDEAKMQLLEEVARRLAPGAPLLLAGNRGVYNEHALLLGAWQRRWPQHGASEDERMRMLRTITDRADPPSSELEIAELLERGGFSRPTLYFSSLFWGAWVTFRL